MSDCGGHAAPWHYHTSLICALNSSTTFASLAAQTGHSPITGVMLDGRGLYGPFETSSAAPTNLDACNGHYGPVPACAWRGRGWRRLVGAVREGKECSGALQRNSPPPPPTYLADSSTISGSVVTVPAASNVYHYHSSDGPPFTIVNDDARAPERRSSLALTPTLNPYPPPARLTRPPLRDATVLCPLSQP